MKICTALRKDDLWSTLTKYKSPMSAHQFTTSQLIIIHESSNTKVVQCASIVWQIDWEVQWLHISIDRGITPNQLLGEKARMFWSLSHCQNLMDSLASDLFSLYSGVHEYMNPNCECQIGRLVHIFTVLPFSSWSEFAPCIRGRIALFVCIGGCARLGCPKKRNFFGSKRSIDQLSLWWH